MIKKFNNFEKLNEERIFNKNTLEMILVFLLAFNSLKTDYHRKYSYEELYNYAQKLDVKNNNPLVKQALNEIKDKIMTDPRIMDKNGLIEGLNRLIFVNMNKDHITYDIYKQNRNSHTDINNVGAFIYYIEDKGAMIFLRHDITLEDIIHEISHYIDFYIGKDNNLTKMFDFNKDHMSAVYLYAVMTDQIKIESPDDKYKVQAPVINRRKINYLSSPPEIYARLNGLRFFLYKNRFLPRINADIDNNLINKLLTGEVYRSLPEKEKKKFKDSDFMEILMYIDIENIREFTNINMYVQDLKNNRGFTPNYA